MMLSLIFPLFLFSLAIHALVMGPSAAESSNSSMTSPISTSNTTTPTLLTLLYRSPPMTNPRHKRDGVSRPVNTCRSPSATFIHSHCVHSPSISGAIQSYLVFCRESFTNSGTRTRIPGPQASPGVWMPLVPRPTAEPGRCSQNEVCVNGKVPGGWDTSMALCVRKDGFARMAAAVHDGWQAAVFRSQEDLDMGGLMASAVVSDAEGTTPIKVQEMEVAFGETYDGISAEPSAASASTKRQTCKNCVELITPDFEPKTNLLTTDIAVAGTAAAASILWLAVLSG